MRTRERKPYTTSDGQWTLPSGVVMSEAMKISKQDAVIRMAVAIEYGQKMREALRASLRWNDHGIAVVRTEADTTKIYQLASLVVLADVEDCTITTFNSFDEAAEFYATLATDHNRAVLAKLNELR